MRRPKRKDSVQRGVEGSGERVGLVLGRKVMGQRLKSMKIQSVMVVSSGAETSKGGGGVVVVRESEVVDRRRERQGVAQIAVDTASPSDHAHVHSA
ncbi:hypothetical protein SO802_022566 [Lithocarpus litseifolius]|uniref:Uncharacterized protein n=1 Tax=Lithocarpus litseifolius TaxID=425828 RepID=A0AAW2C586_9ROSI